MGFDGDAALALQIHGVEHLLMHFTSRKRTGKFEQTIGERGFPVIDVRDNGEISDVLTVHCLLLSFRTERMSAAADTRGERDPYKLPSYLSEEDVEPAGPGRVFDLNPRSCS